VAMEKIKNQDEIIGTRLEEPMSFCVEEDVGRWVTFGIGQCRFFVDLKHDGSSHRMMWCLVSGVTRHTTPL
jgi:hypothetical protein